MTEFDVAAGIGTVVLDDATELGFHCTQIADGSRTIAPATPITCSLLFANLGVLEAANINVRSTSN